MAINKKNQNRKKIILISTSLVFAAMLVVAGLELTGKTNFVGESSDSKPNTTDQEMVNYTPATEEEKSQVETNKTDDEKINDARNQETQTPTVDKNLVISSVEQTESKDVVVQTQLYGLGWQKCTLTLTNEGKKITKTSETLYQSTFSTCLGFSIPASEFAVAGTWQIELSVSNTDGLPHIAAPKTVKVAL